MLIHYQTGRGGVGLRVNARTHSDWTKLGLGMYDTASTEIQHWVSLLVHDIIGWWTVVCIEHIHTAVCK